MWLKMVKVAPWAEGGVEMGFWSSQRWLGKVCLASNVSSPRLSQQPKITSSLCLYTTWNSKSSPRRNFMPCLTKTKEKQIARFNSHMANDPHYFQVNLNGHHEASIGFPVHHGKTSVSPGPSDRRSHRPTSQGRKSQEKQKI